MKNNYPLIFSILFYSLCFPLIIKAQSIQLLQQNKPSVLRGLSVLNDKTAWASGSNGYVAITKNGGKTWDWQQVKGYEKSEFRDIEAFSDQEAIIMSSGTPALVLKTTDGGKSWQEKYHKTDSAYFFDAMDFTDSKHGYILGDPINNKFLLMETKDSGETWSNADNLPDALPGEAAFAASGSCLRSNNGDLYIVSGGKTSRMLTLKLNSNVWNYDNFPLINGKASEGAFSIAIGKSEEIIVGGDYQNDKKTDSVAVICTANSATKFINPLSGPAGYQSCVEFINNKTYLSTGTSGTNITTDGGKTWSKIDALSFNVCAKAKHGKLVLLAGNDGRLAIFKI
ncbi:WD40/YVTN/BNR-like repeat-containing protein [Mucilaginibacter aquaedulcis]|uniref:WD40/YVTN/BNR-like repeat-containing protein n=1 Tax=Mucilaginibacter aquaedulcis TaxID=1187081 RepID=UPI0025B35B5B|nr:YCF48-related protein [Mucilaginibacter aquaedulcis]MDN3547245.1 YCF48-related protein [Mucilaginibacter aquaedulcis]